MAIIEQGGRPRSIRTSEEDHELLLKEIHHLPPEEKLAVLEALEKLGGGFHAEWNQVVDVDYKVSPVSVEEFLNDPYYLGHIGQTLWPALKDDMVELFEGNYHEAALGGSIGWGKSAAISTTYVDLGSGTRRSVAEQAGISIASLTDDGRVDGKAIGQVWKTGRKVCAKMTLASGQWIEVSLDHRIRVPGGWEALETLRSGDLVAVARRVPAPSMGRWRRWISDAEVLVAAALIADGSGLGHNQAGYVKGDRRLVESVIDAASEIDGWDGVGRDVFEGGAHYVYLKGLLSWIRSIDIDCNSTCKRVPARFYGLPDDQLAIFLRWLFTDGNVYTRSPRKIEIALASEGLIDDIQALLRRFGVVARKSYQPKRAKKDGVFHDAWRLQIADATSQLLFLDAVGDIPGKESKCQELRDQALKVKSNPNWDVVPITIEELKEIRRETGPWSNQEWLRLGSLAKGSYLGTQKFCRLCEATGYRGRFYRYVTMAEDVVWERVATIESTGEQDVYEISVPETQNMVINGGPVVHNSYFATTAMSYVLYQMSCLANPQGAYGISDGSAIYLAMLAPSEKVARRVAIQELMGKIEHSPYFKENFKHLRYAPSSLEIQFPSRVWVVAGSTRSTAIIGLNVFSGFIDESSFMGEQSIIDGRGHVIVEDLGEKIHKSIIRRMKSRFQRVGRLPGALITVSSKERPTAFIEKRIKQAKESDDPHFFVREYSTWDVKPPEIFSPERFVVVAGNERVQSRILAGDTPEEELNRWREMGLQVVTVPEDYRTEFERDLDNAIREIAGIATEAVTPFMTRTDKIYEASDHAELVNPLGGEGGEENQHTWIANSPLYIRWAAIANSYERRLPGGATEEAWRPIRHPNAVRYAHWDSSLTGDCTGLVISHVAHWTEVVRKDPFGEEYEELAPVTETDLILRIKPPPGDEIMLSDVRSILYQFMGHGFNIGYVSMDQYQSADSLQQLRKRGVEAEIVSVDKTTDAYDVLKDAIYEGRTRIHHHPWLQAELRNLQRVPRTSGRVKIDHPKRMTGPDGVQVPGSKDVADALAGVTFSLIQRMPGRPVPPMLGLTNATVAADKADHSWVSGGKVLVSDKSGRKEGPQGNMGGPSFDVDGPMPFIKG